MPDTKLIGTEDAGSQAGSSWKGYTVWTKFTADQTGTVNSIKVKTSASTHVKVGIFADNSDAPGALLGVENTWVDVTSGSYSSVSLSSGASITSSTAYWLAVVLHIDHATYPYYDDGSNVGRYKESTADLADNPSGLTAFAREWCLCGYGSTGGSPQTVSPSGIASVEACGTPQLNLTVAPGGIASLEAFGAPVLLTDSYILPSGIPSAEAFGSPSVILQLQIISPSGIASAEAFGNLVVIISQIISPSGISSGEAFGTPYVGYIGLICPTGIVSSEAFDVPTVIKFVWHVILDGQYLFESQEVNRAYVIGRDEDGNLVYGAALNQGEIDLVEERLGFKQDIAIPTTAKAEDVAQAIIDKMRLTKQSGYIIIPQNCGTELWDVVTINDSLGAQTNQKYRVIGIRFKYHHRQSVYQHKLTLGGV